MAACGMMCVALGSLKFQVRNPDQIGHKEQSTRSRETGLPIDCFKTMEYFRFWSQNHCLFFSMLFFQKTLKSIAFPIVCEKGLLLQNRTVLHKPETTVKGSNKITNTSLRNRDRAKYRLDLDSACLKTPKITLISTKLLLFERFGTNLKLSSAFFCCISKLKKKYSLTKNRTQDPH